MNEPLQLAVYRRNGKLFVNPSIPNDIGFYSLGGIIEVEGPSDLARALEEGERQASDALKRTALDRLSAEKPFWQAAGVPTWGEFIRGTTAVVADFHDDGTDLEYHIPDEHNNMLVLSGASAEYPTRLSGIQLATVVLDMFATADIDINEPVL